MNTYTFQPHNLHEIDVDSRRLLFHIPSSALFEADALTRALIDSLRRQPRTSLEALEIELRGRFGTSDIADGIAELRELEIVRGDAAHAPRPLAKPTRFPLTTVVLNVNTGCNLSCT